MKPTDYAKLQDRPRPGGEAGGGEAGGGETGGGEPADAALLPGTWINTNTASTGITKAVVTPGDGGLIFRAFGAGDPEPYDWGEVPVNSLFADGVGSQRAISFTAAYDFGFLETELQTNLAKGLMIITTLNTFKDGSDRSNYFSREYFYKQPVG